jgi:AcrR family transcriptional regulator
MPRSSNALSKPPQARRIATNARILDAALEIFAECGFENTQLDQVAARAGCSRGAIYAQYKSKEEVFLALMEQRISKKFAGVFARIKDETDPQKRLNILKEWIVAQTCDPTWGTLTLEFKLYALRRPESKQRLFKLHDELFSGPARELPELLFGPNLTAAQRHAIDRQFSALGGALSGMVLESHFNPSRLPPTHLRRLIGELFDTLIRI